MDLSTWKGVPRPRRVVLDGRYARLEPLDPARHGDQLYEAASGEESARLHRWLPDPSPASRAEYEHWLVDRAASEDPIYFAVIDKATGRAEGREGLMDIDTANGRAEIGNILWGPRMARGRVATEAFFLMADHVFDLGYRRWQWRCNANNAPSRRAAERFGFTFEGIFRQHMVVKGQNRDTAWFSITDGEWPALRAGYERWLDPANFDAHGQQRSPLRF